MTGQIPFPVIETVLVRETSALTAVCQTHYLAVLRDYLSLPANQHELFMGRDLRGSGLTDASAEFCLILTFQVQLELLALF